MVTTSQELPNSTKNFVKLGGDYLGEESLLNHSMETWLRHFDRFER